MSTGQDNKKIVYIFPNQIKEKTISPLNSNSNFSETLSKPITSSLLKVENLRNSDSDSLSKKQVPSSALDSLKSNLLTLNELHSRLNFLLEEIEELERN